ncbi:unnamed protein product, partial [Prorocentrum cordatum]
MAAEDRLEVRTCDYEGLDRAASCCARRAPTCWTRPARRQRQQPTATCGRRTWWAAVGYFSCLAQAEGMSGGRLGMMYHLCGLAQEESSAGCSIGACGVEHVDIWRLADSRDQATLEAEYHLAPRPDGGPRAETAGCPTPGASPVGSGDEGAARPPALPPAPLQPPPESPAPGTERAGGDVAEPAAKWVCGEELSAARCGAAPLGEGPHASEIAGLGRAFEVPALDGRLVQLGQSLQGGSGCGPGSPAVAMNDVMPGAAQAPEQRAQGPTAAGSGARVSAAPAGYERPVEMLTTVLPGGVDGCVLSDEGFGVLGRDAYLGITGRRHLIQRIAKQRPGVHLGRGPGHPRRQVPHLLADPSQAAPLSPYVTQYLKAVFYVAYPLQTVDADGVRVLHPLGEASDGLFCGLVVEDSDLPLQEFKARTIAHRDGHWRGGRWLTLIPSKKGAAERVEVSSAVPAKQGPPSLIGARITESLDSTPADPRPQLMWKKSKVTNPRCPGGSRRDWKLPTALGAGEMLSASQAGQSLELAAGGHADAAGARDGLRMRGPVQRYRWGKLHASAERPGGATTALPPPIPDAPGITRCRAEWLNQGTSWRLDWMLRSLRAGQSWSHGSPMRVIRRAAGHVASDSAKGFQGPDWHEDVAARDDTHGGEETRAWPLTVGGVMPVLPPCGSIAAVRVLDIVEEHVAGWPADPTMAQLTKAEWPEKVQWAAAQASSEAEWHRFGAELVELGLAVPIADAQIFKIGNREVARRLIINMAPASRYQRMMREDIGTLSTSPRKVSVPLPEGHALLWPSDDQVSAFCRNELPEAWQPYMISVEAIPDELIGVSRAERTPLRAEKLEHAWVQYDINDGDHGEIVLVGRLDELAGSLSEVLSELRAACPRSGIQVAKGKAKHRERGLEHMSADLDGMLGRVGITVEKQLLLLTLVMVEVGQPQVTAKAVLVVLGRWVHIAEVCVPFMGFLNEWWAAGQRENPQAVASDMCGKLLVFCMAATRGLTDLRAKIDSGKIATDASEQAGGSCYSAGLTARGERAATGKGGQCEEAMHVLFAAPQTIRRRPHVVLMELLAEPAAAAVGAHRLPTSVAAHLYSEIEPGARRLARRRWPGVIERENVETLDLERLTRMIEGFRRYADWVFVTMGRPDQDLSTLNVVGQGLEGGRCQLFWTVPALDEASEHVVGKHVGWVVKNVHSLGGEALGQFSQAVGVTPLMLEAKDFTKGYRLGLRWCSWPARSYLPHDTSIEEKGKSTCQSSNDEVIVVCNAADLWPLPGQRLDDPEVDCPTSPGQYRASTRCCGLIAWNAQ